MNREREAWVALHLAPGASGRRKRTLLEAFGSPEAVLAESPDRIAGLLPLGGGRAGGLHPREGRAAKVLADLFRAGGDLLVWNDEDYPPLLKETYDPPLVLFLKGNREALRRRTVGIVGARKADPDAADWTSSMAEVLARSGFSVVSGLAEGIDGAAHRGALRGGGTTVAVLGTGLDQVYPVAHGDLAREITENGVLLTEFPPGTGPRPAHFPRRNRIIAGLSSAVLVAQAAERSGAGITARLALESSRDVFVLAAPPWDERFAGNRRLAREGAAVVQDGEEVALRLGVTPVEGGASGRPSLELLGGDERAVASLLEEGPRRADEICRETGKGAADVLAILMALELGGWVTERPGGNYAIRGAS
ncbi:MAG: DNA-processing protein DprA [Candidatus Eisenbacteria bacterium]